MAKPKAKVFEGTTKSGIKYKVDKGRIDQTRLTYQLVKMNRTKDKGDAMAITTEIFTFFEMVFGQEGLETFMDDIAEANGGECKPDVLMKEAQEVFEAISIKN